MTTTQNPLKLGAKKQPTLKHRPAVWECMLGTVYAADANGNVRYFDYDWAAAVDFASLGEDLRTWRHKPKWRGKTQYPNDPRTGRFVLYTL